MASVRSKIIRENGQPGRMHELFANGPKSRMQISFSWFKRAVSRILKKRGTTLFDE